MRAHLLRVVPAIVLLALPAASAPAAAVQEIWFEVLEDLEGFEECFLGNYSTLYDFGPFESKSMHMISERELDELRAAWAKERVRVAAEIARLESDPAARAVFRVRLDVDKNAYFRDVDKQWIDTHAPFHFVVQRPSKDQPEYYARKAADYAKWQVALHELFLEEYVRPLGLVLRPDYQVFVTAVLPTEGSYADYARRNQAAMLPGMRAHYDSNLRTAVTYEPWGSGPQGADDRRHAVMHELVHAFQHAYSGGRDEVPPHPWINEGLAEYLSSGTSGAVESLREHPLDASARSKIAQILRTPGVRDAYVLPLVDLLDVRNYGQVARKVWQRSRGVPFQQGEALSVFYRQSYLLVYWLSREADERTRAAFATYLKSYFTGHGDREAFERAFAQLDLEQLEASYLTWIEPAAKGWRPARIAEPAPGAQPEASAAPALPEYDPESLRACAQESGTALALAVAEVLGGRAEDARARLEASAEALAGDEQARSRLSRELERVRAWIALRNEYLAWLVERGKKLELEVEGKRVSVALQGFADGVITLAAAEGKARKALPESLPASALDPLQLVDQMMRARDFEASWARFYVAVLGGRDNWETKLATWEKKQPAGDRTAAALRENAAEYVVLRAEGELAARLLVLADEPLPETAEEARALLAEIEALHAARASSASVARALPALRGLAAVCATTAAAGLGAGEILSGEVEELGGERVRIRYPLASAAELADFEHFDDIGLQQGPSATPRARFSVEDGRLNALGRGGLRHVARFRGEQALRYRLRFPQQGLLSIAAAMCDDGAGSMIMSWNVGDLLVTDLATRDVRPVGTTDPIILEQEYALELRHDGSEWVVLSIDGKEALRLGCGARKEGAMLFWIDMDARAELAGIELEGELTADALERMRRAWVAARVEALVD